MCKTVTRHDDFITLRKTSIVVRCQKENIWPIEISGCFENFNVTNVKIKSRYDAIDLFINEIRMRKKLSILHFSTKHTFGSKFSLSVLIAVASEANGSG